MRHRRVFEARLHIGEVGTELGGDAHVAFYHAEQRTVDNCGEDLLLRHVPFLAAWRVTFAFPLTFPHLDHFDVTSKVCGVCFCLFQQLGHGLAVHGVSFLTIRVTFRTTVPETSGKLIGGARFCTLPINEECADTLLEAIGLMTDCASGLTTESTIARPSGCTVALVEDGTDFPFDDVYTNP